MVFQSNRVSNFPACAVSPEFLWHEYVGVHNSLFKLASPSVRRSRPPSIHHILHQKAPWCGSCQSGLFLFVFVFFLVDGNIYELCSFFQCSLCQTRLGALKPSLSPHLSPPPASIVLLPSRVVPHLLRTPVAPSPNHCCWWVLLWLVLLLCPVVTLRL